jgi:hypothetical protein
MAALRFTVQFITLDTYCICTATCNMYSIHPVETEISVQIFIVERCPHGPLSGVILTHTLHDKLHFVE